MITLHDEIKNILIDYPQGLNSSEIAKLVNKRNNYHRKDMKPVPSTQISARINKYKQIFVRKDGFIKLKI